MQRKRLLSVYRKEDFEMKFIIAALVIAIGIAAGTGMTVAGDDAEPAAQTTFLVQ